MNFINLLVLLTLPWAAFAAPDNEPESEAELPLRVEEPVKEPVTNNPTPPYAKPPRNTVPFDSFKLTLSNDKKVVHLMGGFQSGLSTALKNMLTKNPEVEKIILSSGGGSVVEGLAVEKIIRRHGLDTHVELFCASACAEAFQGGKQRTVAVTGRLGFHQATQGYLLGLLLTADESESPPNQLLRDLWEKRGVSEAFIDQMLATANRDIWLPTHETLLAEKIATGITADNKPGMAPVGKWLSASDMEKAVLNGPVWQYVRANQEKTYLNSVLMIWISETYSKDAGSPQELAEGAVIITLLKNADRLPDELLLRFIKSEHSLWAMKPDVFNMACRGSFRTGFPVAPGGLIAERQTLVLEMLMANEIETVVDTKRHNAAHASVIEYWSDMVALDDYDSDNVTRNFCSEPVNYYEVLAKLPVAKRLEYFRALAITLLHPARLPEKTTMPFVP